MNTFRNLRLAVRLDIAALERVSDLGERSESIAHKTPSTCTSTTAT